MKAEPITLDEAQFRARVLGDDAWYHQLYCVEPIAPMVDSGMDYQQAVMIEWESFMDIWSADLHSDNFDPDTIDRFETLINPLLWQNAIREYFESRKTKATHADLGYRRKLAALLMGLDKHEDRYAVLCAFYASYAEEAGK